MDEKDFERVYRDYFDPVYRYALALTRDVHAAEELTQETFAQAVSSIGRFDGSCKVSTWLCAIAKNQLMAYRRRHPLQDSLDELAETGASLAGTAPSPEEETVAAEHKRRLYAAIHDSPEPAREVLYLRLLGGLSFREIGDVLGQSENWARVTYHRARIKLQERLDEA